MNIAGVPGLEPRQAEPESAGLPITPYPIRTISAGKEYLVKAFPTKSNFLGVKVSFLGREAPLIQIVAVKYGYQLQQFAPH